MGHAPAHPAVDTESGQATVVNVGRNITKAQLEDRIWQAVHGRELTQCLCDLERPRPEDDAAIGKAVSVLSCDGVEPPEPVVVDKHTVGTRHDMFASNRHPECRLGCLLSDQFNPASR